MFKKWLLLLLLVFLSSHARSDSVSVIKFLPGFEGPLPFKLETGYIGVGEEEEVQLFYYFIKSERNPRQDPLLIWLSGGPFCSSLSGLIFENGPVAFKSEGYTGGSPTLVSTTYSWTKVASIIYLDQPVGTGFSYSKTQHFDTPSDTGAAKGVDEFLRKWLSKHIEFLSNPFYVVGDSYAGNVVPAAVQEISIGNSVGLKPQINLQGYVLGNPVTEVDFEHKYRFSFAHGMALISDELYQSLEKHCGDSYENVDPNNTKCLKSADEFQMCISGLNIENVLTPYCPDKPLDLLYPVRYLGELSLSLVPPADCFTYKSYMAYWWANDERVRKALHVTKGSIGKWIRCLFDNPYNHDIKSSVPYHANNSIKGYRSLIFSGDHDMRVPFTGTLAWIRSLNYSITDSWRPWMIHNQVAGYTQTYANNLTFATVKEGGHTPEYKPVETFILFQRWISGQPI